MPRLAAPRFSSAFPSLVSLCAAALALAACDPAASAPAPAPAADAALAPPDLAMSVGEMPDLQRPPDLAPPDAGECDPQAFPGTLYATSDTLLGDGAPKSLCRYRGKVLLLFNAAELCGFTYETAGLQALQASYEKRGLSVLGFYSNDFGNQGGNPAACNAKYMVTFDTFEIAPVRGAAARPPYKWLFSQNNPGPEKTVEPQWNFSKYLVGRDGTLAAHFAHFVEPGDPAIAAAIEAELAKAPPK